jgi:hypothetical protein
MKARWRYTINNVKYKKITEIASGTLQLDTTTLPDGALNLLARANDGSNNVSVKAVLLSSTIRRAGPVLAAEAVELAVR